MPRGGVFKGRMISDHLAVRSNGRNAQRKQYVMGQLVRVEEINIARIPTQVLIAYQDVETGYIINRASIQIIGREAQESFAQEANNEFQEAEVIETKMKGKRTLGKSKNKKSNASGNGDVKLSILKSAEDYKSAGSSMFTGAITFGVLGMGYAMWKQKNPKYWGLGAAVVGGFLGKKYYDFIKK